MTKFVAYTGREELDSLTFEWNISEFKKKIKTGKVGEYVKLEDIKVGETNWFLRVFPNGVTPLVSNGVSIAFYSRNQVPITTKLSISVMKNTENSPISGNVYKNIKVNRTFPKSNASNKFSRFFTHKQIKDNGRDFLPNGNLRLLIKMTVFGEEKTTRKPSNNDTQEIGSIEIQEKLKVADHLKDSWTDDKFSDVHIKCGGKIFYCHRIILAKRSQYFGRMLESGMKESTIKVIELEYIDVDILEAILKYIYGGEINNLEKDAVDLLKAAGMFIIEDLKNICEKYLLANYMKLDNVIDVVVMAETHSADHLKKAAMEMIVANNDDIVKQVGWKEKLANSSKLLLIEIFEAMAANKAL